MFCILDGLQDFVCLEDAVAGITGDLSQHGSHAGRIMVGVDLGLRGENDFSGFLIAIIFWVHGYFSFRQRVSIRFTHINTYLS